MGIALRIFPTLMAGALWGTSTLACEFCSPVIFLNQERAKCFVSQFDKRVEKLADAGRSFVEINLEGCDEQGTTRSKSVVQAPGDPDFEGGAKIYLDGEHMVCLRDHILANPDAFDPNQTLKLSEICAG